MINDHKKSHHVDKIAERGYCTFVSMLTIFKGENKWISTA
ncbi:hypothetical protein CHCC15290_4173 [Bacillus licheniformis]|nr:hypothetical protein B4092_1175 [Bacillus licheniformis]TWN17387.1 hypothetical protein CHCC14564_1952 [Bacillus licheniformis LMG 17339]KYC81657.1 hypothetical protein B4090_1424 [Bacillus licheniformis]KYC85279.1 hypothetical protein B4091_1340 [Bacillus licheniformis]OLG00652.1 hypothetical protein B4124_4074 [Bacillus licheniformis]